MQWINRRIFRSSFAGGCALMLVGMSATATEKKTAIFAGGCYWGVEAVFDHVVGVKSATSGFAYGKVGPASTGQMRPPQSGYAEAVRVEYDPTRVTYEKLLEIFFTVAHDPTELDRQGPDVGTQYRSAIFYQDEEQHQAAMAYLAHLDSAKAYPRPIVTEVVPFKSFRAADDSQQDYLVHHPKEPYIVINDAPKVEQLRREFPGLYRSGE